jgi:HD-GYP domain-containing protein (c-di-GMP phosphodiesterase class II)
MSEIGFEHKDILEALNKDIPLKEKLLHAHSVVRQYFPWIARIAVTIYDQETKTLDNYLSSGDDRGQPDRHHDLLKSIPSLRGLLDSTEPQVIGSMVTHEEGAPEGTYRLGRHGYTTSYTMPMFNKGALLGFVFFNSYEDDVFRAEVLNQIDVFGHLITLMVINELTALQTLAAAVKTSWHITHARDQETGSHLDRMSRYAKLIAAELMSKYRLDSDFVEHVFLFAPLHDIGKISVPDSILLKRGKLTHDEYLIMRTHAVRGREIIDDILQNFGLETIEHVDLLRNIAEYHHESVDGNGYPYGKKGDEIPLEARIVAVADVFDALTSRRPYKEAWSNEQAFAWLRKAAGEKLDLDCVEALVRNRDKVEEIQRLFDEDIFG